MFSNYGTYFWPSLTRTQDFQWIDGPADTKILSEAEDWSISLIILLSRQLTVDEVTALWTFLCISGCDVSRHLYIYVPDRLDRESLENTIEQAKRRCRDD